MRLRAVCAYRNARCATGRAGVECPEHSSKASYGNSRPARWSVRLEIPKEKHVPQNRSVYDRECDVGRDRTGFPSERREGSRRFAGALQGKSRGAGFLGHLVPRLQDGDPVVHGVRETVQASRAGGDWGGDGRRRLEVGGAVCAGEEDELSGGGGEWGGGEAVRCR